MIHLTLNNHGGSVEHYYHFLLGFLAPLTLLRSQLASDRRTEICVRSCGPMDKHLITPELNGVCILDKELHSEMRNNKARHNAYTFMRRRGYDNPKAYNFFDFWTISSLLFEIFHKDIAQHLGNINANITTNSPLIVLVNRAPPHSFYLSESCEIKGSGASRRSISNYTNIHEAIASEYNNVISLTLEDQSLAFQMALFRAADIIIAQHGAALANLVWCKPNTTVVEILPLTLKKDANKNHFLMLSHCMRLEYHRIWQEDKHSPVEPDLLVGTLRNVLRR